MRILFNYQNTKGKEDFALTPFLFGVWFKVESVKSIGIGICWGWYAFSISLCNGVPKGFPIYKNLTNKGK